MTNAAKHGIRDVARDSIRVSLDERTGEFELTVEDDGPGYDFDVVRSRSSGLRLVLGLARQIQGKFTVEREPSRASLCFAAKGGA
jgi:two-component sensor histidine kinase